MHLLKKFNTHIFNKNFLTYYFNLVGLNQLQQSRLKRIFEKPNNQNLFNIPKLQLISLAFCLDDGS